MSAGSASAGAIGPMVSIGLENAAALLTFLPVPDPVVEHWSRHGVHEARRGSRAGRSVNPKTEEGFRPWR